MLPQATCTICTDIYDVERAIAAMPCGHTFHDDCLERWLLNTRSCPSCRKQLRKNQQPIHRLFFDLDANQSQAHSSTTATKSPDKFTAEQNRKLKQQLTSLNDAIDKLKRELENESERNFEYTNKIILRDSEITELKSTRDRLNTKVKHLKRSQEDLERTKLELAHLQNIKTLSEGLEEEKDKVLSESGYSQQQFIYISLLRKQTYEARETADKLRRDLNMKTGELVRTKRSYERLHEENISVKTELNYLQQRNDNLKKKCDKLVSSIESPRGVSASLAQRIVNQSPAPQFISPLPVPANTPTTDTEIQNHSTPENHPMRNQSGSVLVEDSLEEDNIKQKLDLSEKLPETSQPAKKTKFINNKHLLMRSATETDVVKISPFSSTAMLNQPNLKPKLTCKIKSKSVLSQYTSGMKDCTNTHHVDTPKSSVFRKGFDGLGGQDTLYGSSSSMSAKLSIFKKPAKRKPAFLPSSKKITEFVCLD